MRRSVADATVAGESTLHTKRARRRPLRSRSGSQTLRDEVAFDQAAPGLVGLWLLALMCAPRRLLSATPMPLRASISKATMSDTTSLSYLTASPWLCNSQRYLWRGEATAR